MKSLNTSEISTASIKVTEKIKDNNLHDFLKTSIKSGNTFFSKNTYYYFYYNANASTYEILFYEKLSAETYLEPFLLVEQFPSIGETFKVLLTDTYFLIMRKSVLLIYKSINNIDSVELSLYIKQIYKIEEFEIIKIKRNDLNILEAKKSMASFTRFYPLYSSKSFFIFLTFTLMLTFILLSIIYFDYDNDKNLAATPLPQNIILNNDTSIIINIVDLFKSIKENRILIEKMSYMKKEIKTTLIHKDKTILLLFVDSYNKNLQIKSLKYNENRGVYLMEISIVY